MIILYIFIITINISRSQDYFQLIDATSNTDALNPHGCYNFAPCKNPIKSNTVEMSIVCPSNECACFNGTSGDLCQTIDNLCDSDPCISLGENFECINSLSAYECKCKVGWTGDNCDLDASTACRYEPCVNGNCESNDDIEYTCTDCDDKLGKNCQYDNPCVSSSCANGATCQVLFGGETYKCACAAGYQNRNCDASSYIYDNPTNLGCIDYDPEFLKFITCSNIEGTVTPTKCRKCFEESPNKNLKYFAVSGTQCRVAVVNNLNMTALRPSPDTSCDRNCGGQKCGKGLESIWVYEHEYTSKDPEAVDTTRCLNNGVPYAIIFDSTNLTDGTRCLCPKPFTGVRCEIDFLPCDDPATCDQGVCRVLDYEEKKFECICPPDKHGDSCQWDFACVAHECQHGSTCVDTNNNNYKCECLPSYYGQYCEKINYCLYNDMCVNGKCENTGDGVLVDFVCKCEPGWEGTYCDEDIDDCDPNPCMYGGTCTDRFLGYDCDCVNGTQGVNCSININDCLPPPCNTKDKDAICVDGINSFTCVCSESWTDVLCDLHILIRDVLTTLYGDNSDRTMLPLLNDLMSNPTQIKDMVPFIIGMQSYDERLSLSWNTDDLFEWASYENKKLNLQEDFTRWNDVVLGNCFTFNNYSDGREFKARSSGEYGGLKAFLDIQSAESLPWLETSGIMVFVHDKREYIFSESVRYNAEPDGTMQIFVTDKRYERLGGVYGKCVKNPTEVKAYFYDGMYTTDGCLRSCYQIMIKEKCKCMDPRYPVPIEEVSCQVSDMTCIEDATNAAGDPTTWPWCECPLPCANQQYSVQWSRSGKSQSISACKNPNSCTINERDAVQISVFMRENEYQTYIEQPSMDLNRFISNLGGLLGVLMGISIISFIEILIMIFTVVYYLISG